MHKFTVLMACLIFLSACKQESASTSTNQDDDTSTPPPINIQAQDFQLNMSVGETKNVVPAHYVTSNADKALVLTKIEPMAEHLTNCNLQQEGEKVTIEATQAGLCAYRYTYSYPSNKSTTALTSDNALTAENTLTSASNIQASGYNFITVQANNNLSYTSLPTAASVVYTLSEGESLDIDLPDALGPNFPQGATLEEVLLFGDGSINQVNKEESLISYTSGETGHSRIVYTLKVIDQDDSSQISYILGAIEIAVSDILNYELLLNSYEYKKSDSSSGETQYVREKEVVTIDVSKAIHDKGEAISDDSDIEILHVFSLDATVSVVSNDQGKATRKFSFKAEISGIYHVAVTIKDSQGAFASGIVSIRVNGVFPMIKANDIIFSPPITKSTADHFNLKLYDYAPDTTIGSYEMGIFNYQMANSFCLAKGWSLPRVEELKAFNVASNPSTQWPVGKAYYTSKVNLNSDTVEMLSLTDTTNTSRKVLINSHEDQGYVTCVQ